MRSWFFGVVLALTIAGIGVLARGAMPIAAGTERADCQMDLDSTKPCRFSIGDSEYEVDRTGRLEKRARDGSTLAVRLPLETDFAVETVLYSALRQDLLLVCEVSDGDVGAGLIVRLDPSTLGVKWRLHFPAFNLSPGALEGPFLYQAGIGTVAKIDLRSGTFVWKHEGLYDQKRYSFNSFRRPEVGSTEVVFREVLTSQGKGPPRAIIVNKVTGKLRKE